MFVNKFLFKSVSTQYVGLPISPAGEPRFEFAMYCGKPAVIRSSDKALIARFVSPTDKSTILSFLALLNRGHFESVANFDIVTKLSENKRQRLENIRALCRNIQRGIVFKKTKEKFLGYSQMPEEEFWAMVKAFRGHKAFDTERIIRDRYKEKNYYSPFINRGK
jgi:hypothetical protein